MLLFDIIIPTYNNLEELKRCLEGFRHQTVSGFRVWVCVDGSEDGTVEYLSEDRNWGFLLSFLEHADKKNHGRSATRNLALPHLSAKYLILLDSDFEVHPDFIQKHLVALEQGGTISVGSIWYEKGNIWRDYDMTRGLHQFKEDMAELPPKYLVTGNTALPTQAFIAVRGFDEQIFGYGGEDTDLGCTIWQKFKYRTVYNKHATAFGKMRKTLKFALYQREEFARTNLKYLLNKHAWATDVFRIDILKSAKGALIYKLTPMKILTKLAELPLLPRFLRIKFVHLLVFCHLYKGYHK